MAEGKDAAPKSEVPDSSASGSFRLAPNAEPGAPTLVPEPPKSRELRRRLTQLMVFRVILITLVLGATTLLFWLSDNSVVHTGALIMYGLIATTYATSLFFALRMRSPQHHDRDVDLQLAVDLAIATTLVHATGGALSAYTFFFPLAIIGAATVRYRQGAIYVTIAAGVLFASVSVLGWSGALPAIEGQNTYQVSAIELSRALALNLAAIAGVGALAANLGTQLDRTSETLESHKSAAADLLVLHRDIVRSLESGLVTLDLDGIITTINAPARSMFGVGEGAAVGAPISAIAPEVGQLLNGLPSAGALRRAEIRVDSGDAPGGVLGISISPLYDRLDEVTGRLLNFQDLTEMRRMEEHLERADRLAVIGSLAAGVAHEIRNPLASISGSVEILRDLPQADDDSRALMDIVTREIDRLNTMITELLAYANPRPPSFVRFDLRSLVEEVLQVFQQDRQFESVDVSSIFEPDASSVEADADPEKIRQALWNLVRNAAESCPDEGGRVEVAVLATNHELTLKVSDNGTGIPESEIDRIFDPFFTTKTKGSGLGLATAHGIISDHSGTLSADSPPNGGAVFTLRIPRYRDGTEDREETGV